MVKSATAAAIVLVAATAQPAAAFTWTLGPPPPLPPLPRAALAQAKPKLQSLQPRLAVGRWEVVSQRPGLQWERVSPPSMTQAPSVASAPQPVAIASTRPLWEPVPTHERILHANILAIVAEPDPLELVQLDRPGLRWESFPAPQVQPHVSSFGMVPTSTVRPVLGRRVWFRF